jgi:hypothetical protein
MGRRLWENLGSLAMALLLALLVWVVALDEENPLEVQTFVPAVPIELTNLPPDMILVSPGVNRTQLTMRAPRQVWQALTLDQIRVTADLGRLGPGTHEVPLVAAIDAESVSDIRLSPDSVTVTLEGSETRSCPIEVQQTGAPALGYEIDEPVLAHTNVTLSGPASAVQDVFACVVRFSIDGLRADLDSDVPVLAVNETGDPVARVTVAPDTTHVSVAVTQKQGFRDVVVRAVITGQVASGYQVTSISVVPRWSPSRRPTQPWSTSFPVLWRRRRSTSAAPATTSSGACRCNCPRASKAPTACWWRSTSPQSNTASRCSVRSSRAAWRLVWAPCFRPPRWTCFCWARCPSSTTWRWKMCA